jgi:hypothetical protein
MMHAQFVGLKEHNREGSLGDTLAAISVVFSVCSIGSLGGHRTRTKQSLGEDFLVTDDGGPRREAAKTSEVVLASLGIQMCDATLRLLAVQLRVVVSARRLALGR